MKRCTWAALLMALVLTLGVLAAQAEIIPPYGEGQMGLQAVVLCEELTLREEPKSSAAAIEKLAYGSLPIVVRQEDGWAYCVTGDSEDSPAGWVDAAYLAIDPARVRTEEKTPVYAWNDTEAPRVALLDADTTLPILKEEGDWLLVSLRGAAGWIKK